MFEELEKNGLVILQEKSLSELPWLRHGFSTRPGGASAFPKDSLNLGFVPEDSRDAVLANRKLFYEAVGVTGFAHLQLRQVHSDRVLCANNLEDIETRNSADAAITGLPKLALTVLTADCVPVIVADPDRHVISVVHAGWRGTLQQVLYKTLERLHADFQCSPGNLRVALGPSIRACCYEVENDVREAFETAEISTEPWFISIDAASKKFRMDLIAANLEQLKSAGVPPSNVAVAPDCTACHTEKYFSHRREAGKTGRLMALVAISP
ncbi:MAG: peptidoglycan editing factor PgeF [Acidobacteriia bacterium]|nr:peptidoglycan editing factor PgeF [Terriglobia bacterium]